MLKKIKEFFKRTGITSIVYLLVAIFFFFKSPSNFNLWIFLSGSAIGLFIYLNVNALWKLFKESEFGKKVIGE